MVRLGIRMQVACSIREVDRRVANARANGANDVVETVVVDVLCADDLEADILIMPELKVVLGHKVRKCQGEISLLQTRIFCRIPPCTLRFVMWPSS